MAERLAHTIKGVAGNFGIKSIFTAAGKLEMAVRDRNPDLMALIKEFGAVLGPQVDAFEQALKSVPPVLTVPSPARTADPIVVLTAVTHLRKSLEASDAHALESYCALVDLLEGSFIKARLERLGTAVKQFDFDAALIELERFAGELGADLRELTSDR